MILYYAIAIATLVIAVGGLVGLMFAAWVEHDQEQEHRR